MRRTPGARRLPKLAALAWSAGVLIGAAVLIATAPDAHARLLALFEIGAVGTALFLGYWLFVRHVNRRLDATMTHLTETLSDLDTDPRTTVTAQRAMDGLRNIWGDQADRWLNKADLN